MFKFIGPIIGGLLAGGFNMINNYPLLAVISFLIACLLGVWCVIATVPSFSKKRKILKALPKLTDARNEGVKARNYILIHPSDLEWRKKQFNSWDSETQRLLKGVASQHDFAWFRTLDIMSPNNIRTCTTLDGEARHLCSIFSEKLYRLLKIIENLEESIQ